MNKDIGKKESITQQRVIRLFTEQLGYSYQGNWEDGQRDSPIEIQLLKTFLMERQGYSKVLTDKAIGELSKICQSVGVKGLYEANKKVYSLLRYGVNVREELGKMKESVHLIDWKHPENNFFGIAEEVSVKGKKYNRRPDLVLYVNGIALGIIELKNTRIALEKGIRQHISSQSEDFIPHFYTAMQLVMAGNDSQGLRYGTSLTSEKYFLKWKEEVDREFEYSLDKYLYLLCNKKRLLELVYDFTIFDKGVKKVCRPNQYFGIKAAQERILDRKGGILWHTQGSGKSLTMVWLTKWIRENITDSRVLIITDREELDDQIEKLFKAVGENAYRTQSGRDVLKKLNEKTESLICSLVHKFGRRKLEHDKDSQETYLKEIKQASGTDFSPKGNIFVFVDECHRTQSGKLHEAMKAIMPEALFIGFTGTPLLKKDKQKSIEIFGPYIGNPYKFDEAVADGVVLDLLYEARDVAQFVTDQKSIDEWFEAETKGLTYVAKEVLKKKWGTMQKVLGSESRLKKIVFDIVKDFKVKPRLSTGEGNAMLVSNSIYQACKYYELFQQSKFTECAIITSYSPHHGDIKAEDAGEGDTEIILKYRIYQDMLKGEDPIDFEKRVKELFIHEPKRMKLLIVVDKLLTGFDAPSATYLYIDKSMQDHGLFQAICRVNRVDGENKTYGYIIDYKDLFNSLEKSIRDYTSEAFDNFDDEDVKGLLKDRLKTSRENLDDALEAVVAICEVVHPQDEPAFIRYFCGNTEVESDLKDREERRLVFYKAVVSLLRCYTSVANEMSKLGYSPKEEREIKEQVTFYTKLRETIKQASRDFVDLKAYEPGMRQLMDMYIDAKASKKISDFENASLVDLIVNIASESSGAYTTKRDKEAMAEKIENNVSKVITEKSSTNPAYYEKMSELLLELIRQRKEETLAYEEYLQKIKDLAAQIGGEDNKGDYPASLTTNAQRALYDNLGEDEVLTLALDNVIQANILDGWRENNLKEKKLKIAISGILKEEEVVTNIMKIIKAQREY
ncbi:MAG: HsdR family type I site-specific deoxyribonuclease [Bacteroidota bacterium]